MQMLHRTQPLMSETMIHATDVADLLHAGQKDKGGKPIFDHVHRVAWAAWALMGGGARGEQAYKVGIKHDLVEDTNYTLRDCLRDDGEEVAGAVALLTHDAEHVSYDVYIDTLADSGNLLAITVKLCDLIDNTNPERSITPEQVAIRARNRDKYIRAIAKLAEARAKLL